MDQKQKVSAILSVVISMIVALLAVVGYDVKVIQPREVAVGAAAYGAAFQSLPAGMGLGERGVTNLDVLDVDGVTTGTLDVAGATTLSGAATLGGALVGSSTEVTLTAGQEIAPAYGLYRLSSTAAVSMTLTAPSAPGQVVYLYGDDNNTITINDTNIRSTDGNAVTIAQYDIVEFISTATEWIHVAKSADS